MNQDAEKQVERPNIVFCVMDDHRFDALGAAGNEQVRTPRLDRLASEGVRFANAYMPGSTCGAVCMPSRAMLHTGRGLFRLEDRGQRIPEAHTTLGEVLREAGYDSFHIGKWHNDTASFNRAFGDGDEIFFGGMGDPWNVPLFHYDPSGEYASELSFIREPKTSNRVERQRGDHLYAGRHCTDVFCDRAVEFIRDRREAAPFFLSVALMAPHDPRTAPPEFHARHDPEKTALPENFAVQCPVDTGALRIRDEMLAGHPRDPGEVRGHCADYHAMIEHLDAGLGRILDAVSERSGERETWFVFVSDHGLSLGAHGLMGKQHVFEEGVRVPLLIRAPGVPAGAVREDPVWHFDLFATLCRVAGCSSPDSSEARDLLPEESAPAPVRSKDELYFGYGAEVRSIREGSLKLIEYVGDDYRATQLFDLEDDPLEMRDLASAGTHRETVRRLRQRLREAATANGDTEHPIGQGFWSRFDRRTPTERSE